MAGFVAVQTGPVSDAAELASISGSLEDILSRLEAMAERYEKPPRDDVLGPLYEAERSLKAAVRRVNDARRSMCTASPAT